jgi:hypothetical protein
MITIIKMASFFYYLFEFEGSMQVYFKNLVAIFDTTHSHIQVRNHILRPVNSGLLMKTVRRKKSKQLNRKLLFWGSPCRILGTNPVLIFLKFYDPK